MNIPSHYQSAFFEALDERDDVDLQVCYFEGASRERAAEGWHSEHDCKSFECFVSHADDVAEMLAEVPEWPSRVHIIGSSFCPPLIEYFCTDGIKWCHWSEMPGIRLAETLGYRMPLYRMLNPLMLSLKRSEGAMIRNHALGAFAQGVLAKRAFGIMGVPAQNIRDLYYTPAALEEVSPAEKIVSFANGRKVFLSVGALCRRKGIDILLKAFAKLNATDWCLVLCGLDQSNGACMALARRLAIEDRVLFLGAYPAARIAEVYMAADVFVLSSRFDGWGAVLNEAASLGMPLIGTDLCGASWHVVEPGVNGFRVRAGSVSSLANAMMAFVDDAQLLECFGAASKELFDREFAPEKNAERMVEALQAWSNP